MLSDVENYGEVRISDSLKVHVLLALMLLNNKVKMTLTFVGVGNAAKAALKRTLSATEQHFPFSLQF